MNDPIKTPQVAQLIQCENRELSFAIDKADVLSIRRTDRFNFLERVDASPDEGWLSDLERSEDVIGWISDGVRKIPICQFDRAIDGSSLQAGTDAPVEMGDSARVVLFTPVRSPMSGTQQAVTQPWGLLVDRVKGMIEVPRDQFHTTPPILLGSTSTAFRSVVRYEGKILMLFDPRSSNPYGSPSPPSELYKSSRMDDDELARLAAAMQVSGNLHGAGAGKPTARGVVVFSLGSHVDDGRAVSIGFSIAQVAEILETASIISVPTASDQIGGLIFWRDIPVPVVDIVSRLGLPSPREATPPAASRHYIIVRHPFQVHGSQADHNGPDEQIVFAAFGINTDVHILRLPIESRPSTRQLPIKSDMIRGQVELEAETLVIPNLQTLLSPQAA